MTTFDSWEVAVRPPEDYLMHFRTKGSKNGVRRYQTESGEWTELGLEERRKREGFGESKAEQRAQKKIERIERRREKKAARAQKRFERSEKHRKKSIKNLTDEEMKAKLERAKMEAEYRDLTKRKSLIDTGVNLVGKILDYKDKKEQRALDFNRQTIELERLKTQRIQAREATKQSENQIEISKNESKKAKQERKQAKEERKGGLKYERKAAMIDAKTRHKVESRGALRTFLKNRASKEKEQRMHANEMAKKRLELTEQRERRANALAVASVNAERSKEETKQSRFKSEEARHKAAQSTAEMKWRQTEAQTAYEKERKKKK